MIALLFLMIFWNTEVNAFYIISILYSKSRFSVAVRRFNNKSQKTSKYCKNIYRLEWQIFVLTSFWHHLLIYYWTDAQHHGIYFEANGFILTLQMDSGSSPVALTTSWECWMFIQGQKCILKTSARKLGVLNSFKICCCQWQIFRTSTVKIFNSYCLWIKIVQQLY